LTDRELDVLRLLGQGKTNPEIAAALFISPRTAGVHVTHILRKLDATTRVQAATVAERAGLLDAGQTDTPLADTYRSAWSGGSRLVWSSGRDQLQGLVGVVGEGLDQFGWRTNQPSNCNPSYCQARHEIDQLAEDGDVCLQRFTT
jgi:DNA-binding CsgD family transcriptional regulator